MRHFVFWFPDADERLQKIVAQSDDKPTMARVINHLDRCLSRYPQKFGESRFENVRVGFVPPLGVQFEILDDPATVIVMDVWRTR